MKSRGFRIPRGGGRTWQAGSGTPRSLENNPLQMRWLGRRTWAAFGQGPVEMLKYRSGRFGGAEAGLWDLVAECKQAQASQEQ